MIEAARVKNSRTAARAVITVMAHHHIMPASYKPATTAQFLLQAFRTYSEDLSESYRLDDTVIWTIQQLTGTPGLRQVGTFLDNVFRQSELVKKAQGENLTIADLVILGQGGRYRYTKIVGNQDFKRRLDEKLRLDLEDINTTVGSDANGISVMIYHLVQYDLYRHFIENVPVLLEDLEPLQPYTEMTLYFALKSFLMARQDVFDPRLVFLDEPPNEVVVNALQRLLQLHGIYRLSDWFDSCTRFLSDTFEQLMGRRTLLELEHEEGKLLDLAEAEARYLLWQRRRLRSQMHS